MAYYRVIGVIILFFETGSLYFSLGGTRVF
jgi:hypothetical protein